MPWWASSVSVGCLRRVECYRRGGSGDKAGVAVTFIGQVNRPTPLLLLMPNVLATNYQPRQINSTTNTADHSNFNLRHAQRPP